MIAITKSYKNNNWIAFDTFAILFLFLLLLCTLLPLSPLLLQYPLGDSSVFVYIASQMLDGKIPYQDIWDHKPPGIYFINALGLFFFSKSLWGIWILQLVFLSFSGLFAYLSTKLLFGRLPALLATFFFINSLPLVLEGGNMPEEFALPLQFLLLFFFFHSFLHSNKLHLYIIGAVTAICLIIKPTTLGVSFIILFSLLLPMRSPLLITRKIWYVSAGAALILIPLVFYFAFHGALYDVHEQVIVFNHRYSQSSLLDRLLVIYRGLQLLSITGIGIFASLAWLTQAALFCTRKSFNNQKPIALLLILFIFEIILLGFGGKTYTYNGSVITPGHYFTPLLPVMTLLSGLFFYNFIHLCGKIFKHLQYPLRVFFVCTITIFSLFFLTTALSVLFSNTLVIKRFVENEKKISNCIGSVSKTGDTVVIWNGAARNALFQTNLTLVNRYLYFPSYATIQDQENLIKETSNDIRKKRPELIIASSTNSFNSLSSALNSPLLDKLLRETRLYIQTNYTINPLPMCQIVIFKLNSN